MKAVRDVTQNNYKFSPSYHFGDGKSAGRFMDVLKNKNIWEIRKQKQFVDIQPPILEKGNAKR